MYHMAVIWRGSRRHARDQVLWTGGQSRDLLLVEGGVLLFGALLGVDLRVDARLLELQHPRRHRLQSVLESQLPHNIVNL